MSARIAGAIEQQAAATRDIAQNVEAAAVGVGSVSASIGGIETMADQTAQATAGLQYSAVELAEQTTTIRERIMGFTNNIRAAQA